MTEYRHLAEFKSKEGYWHSRDLFRHIIEDIYQNYDIKNILEIGFNIGYSASMWLEFDPANASKITSVDIGRHADTQKAAGAMEKKFGDRFEFILCDSKKVHEQLKGRTFDVAFVDGDHSGPGVYNDIELCLSLGIPVLLFDDYWVENDPNPIRAVCEDFDHKMNKISLVKIYDIDTLNSKAALYKNDFKKET